MKVRDEYWDEFIPAMLPTRLGSSTDGDPQLAAAWIGWQAARKDVAELQDEITAGHEWYGKHQARIRKLEVENARLREGLKVLDSQSSGGADGG